MEKVPKTILLMALALAVAAVSLQFCYLTYHSSLHAAEVIKEGSKTALAWLDYAYAVAIEEKTRYEGCSQAHPTQKINGVNVWA